MEGIGGAIKRMITRNKSEFDVSNLPDEMKDFVKLGPLSKETKKAQSTKSLERGLLAADALKNFDDSSLYRKGSPKPKTRIRSCPDATNLKGLTDALDDALAEMLEISGTNPSVSISKPSINEEFSDDDSDNADVDEDNIPELINASYTPGRKISISSTGNPMIDKRMSLTTPAGRLGTRFERLISDIVEHITNLPDDQHKLEMLGTTLQQLRILKSEVQYNAHMAILSTITVPSFDQEEGKGELSVIKE